MVLSNGNNIVFRLFNHSAGLKNATSPTTFYIVGRFRVCGSPCMVPARQKVPGMVPVTVLNLFLHACPMGFSVVNVNFQAAIFDLSNGTQNVCIEEKNKGFCFFFRKSKFLGFKIVFTGLDFSNSVSRLLVIILSNLVLRILGFSSQVIQSSVEITFKTIFKVSK